MLSYLRLSREEKPLKGREAPPSAADRKEGRGSSFFPTGMQNPWSRLYRLSHDNALAHDAAIAKVRGWLRHNNISTTWMYHRRYSSLGDSSMFKVSF